MHGNDEPSSIDFILQNPTGKSFEIHVSPSDSSIHLKDSLIYFAPLYFYTNYSFISAGSFFQITQSFLELFLSNPIQILLNPYNERSPLQHIKHIKNLFNNPPSINS